MMEGLWKKVGELPIKMEELPKKVRELADVFQNYKYQLKLIIASDCNLDIQIKNAYNALYDHLVKVCTCISLTTFECCSYLYGKPLFEWDRIFETKVTKGFFG